jgi:Glutamine amidotransferases class-II
MALLLFRNKEYHELCVIIHQPENVSFDLKLIAQARVHNQDGIGFMWVEDGRVVTNRSLGTNEYARKIWTTLLGRPMAVHFRSFTIGPVTLQNVHPFKILDKEKNGRDLYMMHNGTLTSTPIEDITKSDSWHYAHRYIRPILQQNPDLILNEEFQKFLGASVGQNKMLFMDNDGHIVIINESLGKKLENGCWTSNQYSLKPKKHEPHTWRNTSSTTYTVPPPKRFINGAWVEDPPEKPICSRQEANWWC